MTDPYEVRPFVKPPSCSVQVPGSKSITNRALILAALACPSGESGSSTQQSLLENALQSEDTEVMIDSLQRLGIGVETDWSNNRIIVHCVPLSQWNRNVEFFCGNSGTTIRFLTAMLSLGHGTYLLDGVERMRERPIGDLVEALQQLGVDIRCEKNNGCPPIIVNARGLPGGKVTVRGNISSQYLSALMMAAPCAQQSLSIEVEGELVSVPYVTLTLGMMRDWGVGEWGIKLDGQADLAHLQRHRIYHFKPGPYLARRYVIEPDASSASYFWAAAAITGSTVSVPGLENSIQGDARFIHALETMGCKRTDSNTLAGESLHGIDIDMNAISDTVMSLAVVALFAQGPTTIRNVAHIRHKETDRIAALATELRKVGAVIDEHPDGLTIHPRPLHGAVLDTYDDHRMAMSLALIGLRIPGIFIKNPGCVAKTFPSYWQTLENMRQ